MTRAADDRVLAPNVLRLIVQAILHVPGVARMSRPGLFGYPAYGSHATGMILRTAAEGVSADCYVIARPETDLLDLGMAVQAVVAAVIRDLAGVAVTEVNVYIQDIGTATGYPLGEEIGNG